MDFFKFLFRTGKGGFALGFLSTLMLIFVWNYTDFLGATRRVSETKAAGLASFNNRAPAWSPQALWRQPQLMNVLFPRVPRQAHFDYDSSYAQIVGVESNKKILRKAQIEISAKSPLDTMNRIRDIAQQVDGVVDSASSQDANEPYARADIAIRVRAEILDATLEQIRRLATQINTDQVEVVDVTKQYVDDEAQIRNLQAQEQQYLKILEKTKQVSEVLEVTERLDGVRGQIDKAKAEFWVLQHDIAMSVVRISIRRDSASARFYNWRPIRQIRESASSTVEGMIGVFNGVIAIFFYIPVLLLWLLVVLFASVVLVRFIRVIWNRMRPLYG